jgi:SAM-dependent methyltransferase
MPISSIALMLQDRITSMLRNSSADQYSLYRQVRSASMSEITKAIAELQQKKIIHVVRYRKNNRTGLDIPIYSLSAGKNDRLDVHDLLAGVTSERLVEYDFLSRNLVSNLRKAKILDIGSAKSELVKTISEFGSKWQVFGIDLAQGTDITMDARLMAFRDRLFEQVICISTLEHIGLSCDVNDKNGDKKTIQEIFRILKKDGSAIITLPYGSVEKSEYRVYNRKTLDNLVSRFSVTKKEFYRYDTGKWEKCSQAAAEQNNSQVPLHFHSGACACLLLRH